MASAATLQLGKIQAVTAMARLNKILIDIDTVLTENRLSHELSAMQSKKPKLNNEQGHHTVLASQTEHCRKNRSSSPYRNKAISRHSSSTASRKRPREEYTEHDDETYEIVFKNDFQGRREEILSCFNCQKLLAALCDGTVENGKILQKRGDVDKPKPTADVKKSRNSSAIHSDDKRSNSKIRKLSKEMDVSKDKSVGKKASLSQEQKSDDKQAKEVKKSQNKSKNEALKKNPGLIEKEVKEDKNFNRKGKTTRKRTAADTAQKVQFDNKEEISNTNILVNNSVFKEIMNSKEIKKEPDTESILSERTRQLYEMLAGN